MVYLSIVLVVIVVMRALSVCLSGQLIHSFIHAISLFQLDLHCRIGMCGICLICHIVSLIYALFHLSVIGSVLVLNSIVRSHFTQIHIKPQFFNQTLIFSIISLLLW